MTNANETDFKILTDRDHILAKPGMYIGSTALEELECFVSGEYKSIKYIPGLAKIINEIIDNSIDEAIRTKFKHGNEISVTVNVNEITVEDNGRGIPQDLITDTDGSKILRPVAAWTKAKAGSNFTDDREGIGTNGVGSFCTNIFSQRFVGKTGDGKNTVTVSCSNNASRIFVNETKGKYKGTSVTFVPDFNRFEIFSLSPNDVAIIRDRVETLAVAYPEITFRFNKKKVSGNIKQYAKLYGTELVFDEGSNVTGFIGSTDEFRQNSFVNGVGTSKGGTHVDYFMNRLTDAIVPLVKRKHKVDVTKPLLKNGLMLGLFVRGFTNPKFDSQTKERLTNSQGEVSPYLKDLSYEKIAKRVVDCDAIIHPIIDNLLAKQMAAEARELAKKQKEQKRKKVDDHIKASQRGGTLFLAEGKSAIGYLIKVRDSAKHGGYALRGKPMNTWNEKPNKIMKCKELSDVMAILDIQLGNEDIRDMYYQDIGILVDADVDGQGSIYPLLLAFFNNWPDLYKQGRVKFIKTPVIIATKGKGKSEETRWFYNLDDYRKSRLGSTWKIRYIKGLGSLTEKEYGKVINEPVYDVVEIDDTSCFDVMFGDDSQLRKDWMSK
ncbi:DNA topoisomerase II large subunit [Vibrio phage D479]